MNNKLDNQLKAAPSKEAIVKFLTKQPNATEDLIRSFLERTALVAAGIIVLGKPRNVLQNSLAASIAIELYLLWFYNKQLKKKRRRR